jgi:flagellar protein FliO/FliZ
VIGLAIVGLILVTTSRSGESRSLYALDTPPAADSTTAAAAPVTPTTVGAGSATLSIIKMLAALAVVIGCIYVAIFLLKKLMARRQQAGSADRILQILETAWIDPKKSLSLVRVADKAVLIGVTDNQISVLTELDPEKTQLLTTAAATAERANFSGFLKAASDKWKGLGGKGNQLSV